MASEGRSCASFYSELSIRNPEPLTARTRGREDPVVSSSVSRGTAAPHARRREEGNQCGGTFVSAKSKLKFMVRW